MIDMIDMIDRDEIILKRHPVFCPRRIKTTFSFRKIDAATDMGLAGALFEMRSRDGCVMLAASNADGSVSFDVCTCTHYELRETQAPPGYSPSSDVLTVFLDGCGNVTINGVFRPLLVLANESSVRAEFTAFKVNSATGLVLPGAQFTIFFDDQVKAVATSDENGGLSFTNIAPGSYTMRETITPPGFIPNMTTFILLVDMSGNAFINGVNAEGFVFQNDPLV